MRTFAKSILGKSLFNLSLVLALVAGGAVASQKAASFSLPGVKSTVNLANYRGKVVYVDFWASWCDPCRKSFPWMNKMQEQYKKYGFEVVAINLDEDKDLANQFLNEVPANFTIAFDPKGKTAESYGLKVMPSSYLIDKNGNLVTAHRGFKAKDTAKMEQQIRQLLAQK